MPLCSASVTEFLSTAKRSLNGRKQIYSVSVQHYLRCGTNHLSLHLTANLPKANLSKTKLNGKVDDNKTR